VERGLYNEFRFSFGNFKDHVPVRLTSSQLEVLAHNIACEAVWTLQGNERSSHVVGVVTATGKSRIKVNS
jgi:hypothetical protein